MKERRHEPYFGLIDKLKRQHIKYKDVADKLGITLASVWNKINGCSDFTLPETNIIFTEFGISTDDY